MIKNSRGGKLMHQEGDYFEKRIIAFTPDLVVAEKAEEPAMKQQMVPTLLST